MPDHRVSDESIGLAIGEFTASNPSSSLVTEKKVQCQWGFMMKSYGGKGIDEKDVCDSGGLV